MSADDDLCFPPVDPYAEARAAFADGELQVKQWDGSWIDTPRPGFVLWHSFKPSDFRRRPKDDGWISWPGGECPIPWANAGEYEAKARGGSRYTLEPDTSAKALDWRDTGADWNIIAYRLKPPTAATVADDSSGMMCFNAYSHTWDLGHFPADPIPSAEDRKTAQEYAAALHGDDDPVQDTDRPGIANAAMHKAMTTPKQPAPEKREEPGLLTVADLSGRIGGKWGA